MRYLGKNQKATLFVGQNVGATPRWTIDQVIEAFATFAKPYEQSASFVQQKGLWYDSTGKVVRENSVQIVLLAGTHKAIESWVDDVADIAVNLCKALLQDAIYIEFEGPEAGLYEVTQ
jgi:hypothetical protein